MGPAGGLHARVVQWRRFAEESKEGTRLRVSQTRPRHHSVWSPGVRTHAFPRYLPRAVAVQLRRRRRVFSGDVTVVGRSEASSQPSCPGEVKCPGIIVQVSLN